MWNEVPGAGAEVEGAGDTEGGGLMAEWSRQRGPSLAVRLTKGQSIPARR